MTAFYNYWLGFVTLLNFCWVDQYDVMAGPNRKSRRLMEEENKKLRKKARREYNDTVRRLAEFVKKRDKRVIDMQKKRNEEIDRKKEEERERKKELERQKAERARNYEEPGWTKVDMDDEEEEIIEETTKKGDGQELYCVACGKKFKSEKQWKNHEQSKKHKEKVAELREAFDNEDEEYGEEEADELRMEEEDDGVDVQESEFLSADDEVDGLGDQFTSTVEIREDDDEVQSSEQDGFVNTNTGSGFEGLHPEMGSDDHEGSVLDDMVSGHKNRKNVRSTEKPKRESKKTQVEIDSDDLDVMEDDNLKVSRRNRGRRKQRGRAQEEAMQTELNKANGQPENNENDDNSMEVSADSLLETESIYKSNKVSKPDVSKKGSAKQNGSSKSREATKGRKKKVLPFFFLNLVLSLHVNNVLKLLWLICFIYK